jgi:XRE family transcriptional regulator, fatty acid utilization regulator
MARERPVYMGPRLRRLRRDLGLTQANLASDLDISASYIALLERNQRPLTADLLLRIARIYRIDMGDLAGDGGAEYTARLQGVLKDPLFADLDLPPLDASDVATNYPGITEALLRLHTAYREEQLALADQAADAGTGNRKTDMPDPVAESRRFLASRRNSFPQLDDRAEALAAQIDDAGGLVPYFKARHQIRVRAIPRDVMVGSLRRYDRHREELLLDDSMNAASRNFQMALQLCYMEMRRDLDALIADGSFTTENSASLTRRALANYAAAAVIMPYTAFAKAVEAKRYDVEALSRLFSTSFEQTAHRLTTLQKPGQERVPFFFIRVDAAGNVSKRLDGANFPFARHGGGCPLWSVHRVFRDPGQITTQWLELPDGERFFSIARTVTAGGGAHGVDTIERAVAICCAAEHAGRLIYTHNKPVQDPTPIGVSCVLCHRADCAARAAPPIGRTIMADDNRRSSAPFGFSDG